MEVAESEFLFKWAGWALSLIFGLAGIFTSFFTLKLRARHAQRLAEIKDIHDAIDRTVKSLIDFEDTCISFWTDKDTKFNQAHLIVAHRRLVVTLKQLLNLREGKFPTHDIGELRRAATLDIEMKTGPLSPADPRVLKILSLTSRLMASELLVKRWEAI